MYKQLGQKIGQLVDEKNKAYGGISKVAEAMKIFYPDGISFDKLTDALLIVRILDKVNRISGGDKKAFGENPFKDISGYGLLGCDEVNNSGKELEELAWDAVEPTSRGCFTCANRGNQYLGACKLSHGKMAECKRENLKHYVSEDALLGISGPEVTE